MLDFPFFSLGKALGCLLVNVLERESYWFAQTEGHSEPAWADWPSHGGGPWIPVFLSHPQNRSRLNQFQRHQSEFWFFFSLSLSVSAPPSLSFFSRKPFTKATSIVIDWFLWFSVLLPFRTSKLLRIKLLRNQKQKGCVLNAHIPILKTAAISLISIGSCMIFF